MAFKRNVVIASLVGVVVGVALVSVGTATFHAMGSMGFCGRFCHTMQGSYKSFQRGLHGSTYSGFQVTCSDCHLKYASEKEISQAQVVGMIWHKATSGLTSFIGQITGKYAPHEAWVAERDEVAEKVIDWMASTNFRNCRGCHNMAKMKVNEEKPMVAKLHKSFAKAKQINCISCHATAGHLYIN